MKIVNYNPQPIIKSVVKNYKEFIAPSYGPAGKTILIDEQLSVKSVDDGKIASQEYEETDELRQTVVKYIREATEKTDRRVGDGTTTGALIMCALYELLNPNSGDTSFTKITTDLPKERDLILKGLTEAVESIKKLSKKIKTQAELYEVAYNSFNNEEIAKLVSKAIFETGVNGVVSVEDSRTMKTEMEKVEGMEIDRGFVSPYFINNEQGVELESSSVILVDGKLDNVHEVLNLMQTVVKNGVTKITVIAEDFSDEVVALFVVNKLKGGIQPLLVKSPGYGDNRKEQLHDLASIVGCDVIDLSITKLTDSKENHIGIVDKIKSTKEHTTFIQKKPNKKAINERVTFIKKQLEESSSPFDKERYANRIAQITGGIALLKVGAHTEQEQKTLKAKVEDSVSATRVALEGGVVPGGGNTLASIKTCSELLNQALKAPKEQLEKNGKHLLDKNVQDPALVLIAALETAVSITLGLCNISSIVAIKKEKKEQSFGDF